MPAEGAIFNPEGREPVTGFVVFGEGRERFSTSATELEGTTGTFVPHPHDDSATFAPFVGTVRVARAERDDRGVTSGARALGAEHPAAGYEIGRLYS